MMIKGFEDDRGARAGYYHRQVWASQTKNTRNLIQLAVGMADSRWPPYKFRICLSRESLTDGRVS